MQTFELLDNGKENKPKKKIKWLGLLFLIFISLYSCNNDSKIILYGGYSTVVVFTFIAIIFSGEKGTMRIYDICKSLFWFCAYCVASYAWAWSGSRVFEQSIVLVCGTILVIIMTNYFVEFSSEDTIFMTIAISGVILSGYVIYTYGGLSEFYHIATMSDDIRMGGEINNPNLIGMQCAYSCIVLMYMALFNSKKLCYVLFLIPAAVAVSSGSRKAVLILILGVFMILYIKNKSDKTIAKYLKYIIFISIGVLFLNYVLKMDIFSTFISRMESFLYFFSDNSQNVDSSSRIRGEMISVALTQFINDPVLGIGHANSSILNAIKLCIPAYSHCDYTEVLVNGGTIGFILYYYFVIYKIFAAHLKILKNSNDSRTELSFVILIIFIFANFACVTYYDSMFTYVLLILWTTHIEKKKKEGVLI